MTERPIIFSAEMVRAILDGRKTQTRRVIKTGILAHSGMRYQGIFSDYSRVAFVGERSGTEYDFRNPYGKPGDLLWVKEAFQNDGIWGLESEKNCSPIFYRASPHGQYLQNNAPFGMKWKPSIFMPKRLTRLWLKVTGIRVERVQDISEEDARAEGFPDYIKGTDIKDDYIALRGFQLIWDSINKKRGFGWDVNPWVWVIEFERVNHD